MSLCAKYFYKNKKSKLNFGEIVSLSKMTFFTSTEWVFNKQQYSIDQAAQALEGTVHESS